MKNNREAPKASTAVGIAGAVRKPLVSKNSALEAYEDDSAEGFRREMYDGRIHTVFPAILIVEGVLNGALVAAAEFGSYVQSWNGRAIPILHPEELGEPISVANSPEVLERSVGTIFNARLDGDRLKAELWIDEQKMDRLGFADLLSAMREGEILEISTGYFSDDLVEVGVFNGKDYTVRHVNIRPDHVALLPGQIGACSILDGCGAPRINTAEKIKMKINDAASTIMAALGLKSNCECGSESTMKTAEQIKAQRKELLDRAKKLHANGALGAKHLKMLEELDDDGLAMMSALISAYSAKPAAAADEPPPGDDEDPAAMAAKKAAADAAAANAARPATNADGDHMITINQAELDRLVANSVANATERATVTAALKAHGDKNPFSDDELGAMPIPTLKKFEKSLRVNDYTGAGGFPQGMSLEDNDDSEPLRVNQGILSPAKAAN